MEINSAGILLKNTARAEIDQTASRRSKCGVTRSKKLSTRVDLTPMVDLGFLLITFFIFTTSLAHPTVMRLTMPDDKNVRDSTEISDSKTLSFIIGKGEQVFYYDGRFKGVLLKTSFGAKGFRSVIIERKQKVRDRSNTNDLVVLLKVTEDASYRTIVKCLDEMLINSISTYMRLDATTAETKATFKEK